MEDRGKIREIITNEREYEDFREKVCKNGAYVGEGTKRGRMCEKYEEEEIER